MTASNAVWVSIVAAFSVIAVCALVETVKERVEKKREELSKRSVRKVAVFFYTIAETVIQTIMAIVDGIVGMAKLVILAPQGISIAVNGLVESIRYIPESYAMYRMTREMVREANEEWRYTRAKEKRAAKTIVNATSTDNGAHVTIGKIICVLGVVVMLAGIAAMIYVAQSGYGDDWFNLSLEFGKELGYTQELNFVDNVWYHIIMYRVQLAIGGAVAAVIGYLVAIWDRLNINIHIEKKGN